MINLRRDKRFATSIPLTARSVKDRLTERHFAGDGRAGTWSAQSATRRRRDFLRHHWPLMVVPVAAAAAVAPAVVILAPVWCRQMLLGADVASGLWGAVYLVAAMSGAASVEMGCLAEQWTAKELRRLRRNGWRLVNELRYRRRSDVDHVLVGPGGAVVVETKYRADGWQSGRYADGVIAGACLQVERNVEDVWLTSMATLARDQVRGVVVVWGGGYDRRHVGTGRVEVVSGADLRGWLAALPRDGLDEAGIETVYRQMVDHAGRRDRWDADHSEPTPRSFTHLGLQGIALGLVALAGLYAEAVVEAAVGWAWCLAAAFGLVAVAWGPGWRRRYRPLRMAWTVGTQMVTAGVVVLVALSWTHVIRR